MNIKTNILFWWIAVSTVIVGTLDAIAAILVYNADSYKMFRFIASAALPGEIAFGTGVAGIVAGIFFHYFIACCWTLCFGIMYQRIGWIRANRILSGLLLGVVIWIVMNLIVLKLSRIDPPLPPWKNILTGTTILMLAVGLPLSMLATILDKSKGAKTADN